MSSSNPTVTVAIPAYNEAAHIEQVVGTFARSGYPHVVQILVGDGGSTDGTVDIVERLANADPRVRLVRNPDRVQSAALNRMLEVAEGDLFLRADAHCEYAPDYVRASVEESQRRNAQNMGGAQRFLATNAVQAGISMAVLSPLGSGGAAYRDARYDGPADTVFLGCYRTQSLRDLGGFRTDNGVNEDTELNVRLRKAHGESVFISSRIEAYYHPRSSWSALIRQYYRYGRSRLVTSIRHPEIDHIRGRIPFYLLMALSLYAFAEFLTTSDLGFVQVVGGLLAFSAAHTLLFVLSRYESWRADSWRGESPPPTRIALFGLTWVSILCIQAAHAVGYALQWFRYRLSGEKTWSAT